jgi:Undecaprenyl-phosphate glucose phosphotransferase
VFRSTEFPLVASLNRIAAPLLVVCTLLLISRLFEVEFTREYLVLAVLSFLASSLVFGELNPFRSLQKANLVKSLRNLLIGWLFVFGILLFVGYATKFSAYYSRRVLLTWFLIAPLTLFLCGVLAPALIAMTGAGRQGRTAVIAGASELGLHLAQRLETYGLFPTLVKAYFDDREPHRLPARSREMLWGTLADLANYVQKNCIQSIYITLPMAAQPRTLKLLDELKDTTASVYFVPDVSMFILGRMHFDEVGSIPVLAVCESPFTGVNGIIKRACDLVIALLVLVLLLPLIIAIAISVKLSSAGPIIFKQRRYGLDGREIVIYKFRTMSVCEDGPIIEQAKRNDNRVTRIGAFLRRTSLDELPQFINVLQGRMSVVGPRPHAVAHNEMYRKLIKGYMMRHKVRPGITGWAQIHGLRGRTDTVDKMRARIEYDLDYLRSWSLLLDLWIIVRTAGIICKDAKAY